MGGTPPVPAGFTRYLMESTIGIGRDDAAIVSAVDRWVERD